MKKLFISLNIFLAAYCSMAQDKYTDSLKNVLAGTSKPIEQFTLLNKIREANDATQGNFQDTSLGVQLYRIAQQLKNDSLLAISINVIGNYFRSRGESPAALEYFFKAIPLAEKAKDKRRISSLYLDVAESYSSLKNEEESFKYAKIAEANLPDKSAAMYDFMAGQYYRTVGRYYLRKNQPDSALVYIHQLEQVNRRLIKPTYQLIELIQNGEAYTLLKDFEMAELYYKKANNLSDSIGTSSLQINFTTSYLPYLITTNQFEKVKQYALRLLKTGNNVNNNIIKLTAAGFLNTAYSNLKQPDSAYFYLSMQSALKDSVFSQNNFNKIQALAFTEQIRKIDEESKLAAAKEERRQNIQYALIALGIITLLILYLLLSRSFITNTKLIEFFGVIALLIVFEFLNLLLHPFLERITNHSPVLMLLALVCIAALLVPLHHKVEKWATAKLVEKNKKIRLAAAKKTIEQLEKEI
jgi:tetratricopeptide (TPR) repeat protein